nr:recombinase family protein [Nocardioides soli]
MTGRQLRVVPEAPPRALGLVRVSQEREGMISPEVQRTAIIDYAATRGYEIAGWLEGIDESGSRARSAWWPRLDQAVAAIEAGEYDVLVVWKYSRAARHRLRWAVAIDRVEEAGGRLESATEQFDTTTSSGRLARGMLAELQAFEAERIGEVWKEVHASRVRAGRPPTGKDRFGYVYDREKKLHVPNPVTAPVLADMYRRYVAGESVYQLVRWLNAHGHLTVGGYGKKDPGPWSDRTLRRVLDSGFATGSFLAGGDRARKIEPTLHPGVHEPVIDQELWQAYLDARRLRAARPARTIRSQYLLSGLIRCGRCGGSMVAGQFGAYRVPKYRCQNGKEIGPAVCKGGYVMASHVEDKVYAWLVDLAGEVDERRNVALAAEARVTASRSEADRLARAVARVDAELQQLALSNASAPLPPEVYAKTVAGLVEKRDQLQAAHEDAAVSARRGPSDPVGIAQDLLGSWDDRPVEHRREVLRDLIRPVRVWTGRPRADVVVKGVWER